MISATRLLQEPVDVILCDYAPEPGTDPIRSYSDRIKWSHHRNVQRVSSVPSGGARFTLTEEDVRRRGRVRCMAVMRLADAPRYVSHSGRIDKLIPDREYRVEAKVILDRCGISPSWTICPIQLHASGDPGDAQINPPIAILMRGGRGPDADCFQADIAFDPDPVQRRGSNTQMHYVFNGRSGRPLVRYTDLFGQELDWVLTFRYMWDLSGWLEVWLNGRRLLRYDGPVGYNDDPRRGLYITPGIYRTRPGPDVSLVVKRILVVGL